MNFRSIVLGKKMKFFINITLFKASAWNNVITITNGCLREILKKDGFFIKS